MPVSVNHLLSLEWKTWSAKNNPPDALPVSIFAFSDAADTTSKTIWDGLPTAYSFPTTASTMGISSTSVTGDAGGIVTINGLDSDWNPISETVTLDGVTPVPTINSYYRINMFSMTTPANGNSTNLGTITAKHNSTTYAQINPSIGTMQAGFYSVPSGWSLYIYAVDCYSGDAVVSNKYIKFNSKITNHNGVRPMTYEVLQRNFSNAFDVKYKVPQVRSQKTDIEWQFSTSGGTQSVSLIVQGYLLTNN